MSLSDVTGTTTPPGKEVLDLLMLENRNPVAMVPNDMLTPTSTFERRTPRAALYDTCLRYATAIQFSPNTQRPREAVISTHMLHHIRTVCTLDSESRGQRHRIISCTNHDMLIYRTSLRRTVL